MSVWPLFGLMDLLHDRYTWLAMCSSVCQHTTHVYANFHVECTQNGLKTWYLTYLWKPFLITFQARNTQETTWKRLQNSTNFTWTPWAHSLSLSLSLFAWGYKVPFSILLTHKGSKREVYQEIQPSYDLFQRWCQGLFRPQVPCTPNLHCPIANSVSTQSQQPV